MKGNGLVVGAIVVAIALGFALAFILGSIVGTDWAEAADSTARAASQGTGIMGHYPEDVAMGIVWVGGLVAIVPAAIIGRSPVSWRRIGLIVLVVAVTSALVLGFASTAGDRDPSNPAYGDPELWPEVDALSRSPFALFGVTLGALIGYWVGSRLRTRARSDGRSVRHV